MKILKGFLWFFLVVIVISIIAVGVIINPFGPSPLNKFTKDGNLVVPGLTAPVTVNRDERAWPISTLRIWMISIWPRVL